MKNRSILRTIAATLTAAFLFGACGTAGGAAGAVGGAPVDAGNPSLAATAAPEPETLTAAALAPNPELSTPRGNITVSHLESLPASFDVNGWGQRHMALFSGFFDTVLRFNPEGDIAPGIATDWQFNDNHTELSLTIRDGVYFTDGTPLDAEAVAANINRFRDSTSPDIRMASFLESAQVTEPNTVLITMYEPDPNLLINLTASLGFLSSPASWDNPDVASNPVGSGPYLLDVAATIPGSTYVLRPNPAYWDTTTQQFESITIRHFAEVTAKTNALLGHQIDMAWWFGDWGALPRIEAAGYELIANQMPWFGMFLLDRDGVLVPELGDVRVRQAINYAINGEAILEHHLLGNGWATNQVFGRQTLAYMPEFDNLYPYNPDRARELLAEAGVTEFSFQIPVTANMNMPIVFSLMQMLSDVGITVEPVQVDITRFNPAVMQGNFPAVFSGANSTSDWRQIQETIATDGAWNPFRSRTDELDGYLTAFQWAANEDDATKAAQAINRFVTENAWFAPFYFQDNTTVVNPETVTMWGPIRQPQPAWYMVSPAS